MNDTIDAQLVGGPWAGKLRPIPNQKEVTITGIDANGKKRVAVYRHDPTMIIHPEIPLFRFVREVKS